MKTRPKAIFKVLSFLAFVLFFACCSNDAVDEINEEPISIEDSLSTTVETYISDLFQDGYTLISPLSSKNAYLIDMEGYVVKVWETDYTPGNSVYLLEDGRLLRTIKVGQNPTFAQAGGQGGGVQLFSFDGELEWNYELNTLTYCSHHDIEMLPNGNILMIVWEKLSQQEVIELGRDSELISENGIWSEMIQEIKPTGNSGGEIIWEWHLKDHFVQDINSDLSNYNEIASHPELVNLNYNPTLNADLFHMNAVEYIAEYDLLLLSSKSYCELWIIDHSTTTLESASHSGGTRNKGGDLLYRWGNSLAYNMGTSNNQLSFGQHNPTWIEGQPSNGGNVLLFNNGDAKNREYSTADEISLPHDGNGNFELQPNVMNEPQTIAWSFANNDLYSQSISGCQRLENGNTLICEGQDGVLWEVTPEKQIVWKYAIPLEKASSFRALRYKKDYSGLSGKALPRLDVAIN